MGQCAPRATAPTRECKSTQSFLSCLPAVHCCPSETRTKPHHPTYHCSLARHRNEPILHISLNCPEIFQGTRVRAKSTTCWSQMCSVSFRQACFKIPSENSALPYFSTRILPILQGAVPLSQFVSLIYTMISEFFNNQPHKNNIPCLEFSRLKTFYFGGL